MPARPTDAERRRLHELFARLCAIDSPYGHEQACAAAVEEELRRIGLAVERDDFGNLLARRSPPTGGQPGLLLCAHLDTVPRTDPSIPIEPVEIDGGWENAHADILGADNKAAVAVMLVTAQRAVADGTAAGLELLFTLQEENALVGAKAFDVSRLRSRFGYVFDQATPIGEIVAASPTYYRLETDFRGRAAHAGLRPQDGRSAIVAAARAIAALSWGRLDDRTTANVGTITGGTGVNVVPEHCRFVGEVRSLDDARAEALVTEAIERIQAAAGDPDVDVDVDASVARLFAGYRHRPDAPAVRAADAALRLCGYEPRLVDSGGGSDANVLQAAGFHCVCLANGTERNHEPTERVSFDALEGMLAVSFALLGTAAEIETQPRR